MAPRGAIFSTWGTCLTRAASGRLRCTGRVSWGAGGVLEWALGAHVGSDDEAPRGYPGLHGFVDPCELVFGPDKPRTTLEGRRRAEITVRHPGGTRERWAAELSLWRVRWLPALWPAGLWPGRLVVDVVLDRPAPVLDGGSLSSLSTFSLPVPGDRATDSALYECLHILAGRIEAGVKEVAS